MSIKDDDRAETLVCQVGMIFCRILKHLHSKRYVVVKDRQDHDYAAEGNENAPSERDLEIYWSHTEKRSE